MENELNIKACFAAVLLFGLAACSAEVGGAGRLSTGEPVTGTFAADATKGRNVITIASPAGWSCQSIWDDTVAKGAAATMPMTCTDGSNGTLILTMNNISKQMTGSFHLDNGKTGQVEFGFKPT